MKLANEAHLGHVQFIEEKIGGSISWRKRQIAAILEQAQEGDTIIVSELSRLGRSMLECMEILSLAMQKGIRIYAVKGNWQRGQRGRLQIGTSRGIARYTGGDTGQPTPSGHEANLEHA